MAVCLPAGALIAPAFAVAQSKPPDTVTKKTLKHAISAATTSDDHLQIAQYCMNDAERLDGEAKGHAALAETYRKSPTYNEQKHSLFWSLPRHCQWLAKRYTEMAQKEREIVKLHEDMATSVTR